MTLINIKFVLIENINAVLNVFPGKRPNQGVVDLASRWLSVFEHHGVRRTQIPRLLPDFQLRLDMLADESKLLELLTDELCTATCELFNVERSWLDGDSDRIYASIFLDDSIDTLLARLVENKLGCDGAELLAFRSRRQELQEDWGQFGVLVIRSKIRDFEEKCVYRYTPIFSLRYWGNSKQKYLATRAVWAAHALGYRFWGGQLDERACKDIAEGTRFPESCMHDQHPVNWHPDDYVHRPSVVAKGSELLNRIVKRSREDGTSELIAAANDRLSKETDGTTF